MPSAAPRSANTLIPFKRNRLILFALISARRFKELGAATGEEIVEIELVDESPRALAIPEKSET